MLLLAREMGVLKMGTVALDGTKIHANASRHSALSYEHAGKVETRGLFSPCLPSGYRIMSTSALRIDSLGMPNRPP